MKIAHLSSVHVPGDTRILHREAATLARAGHDVVLIAAGELPRSPPGVRFRGVPRPSDVRSRFLRTIGSVYTAAVDEAADVYHLHDPELLPIGALLRLRGARVVYDVHEDYTLQTLTKPWVAPRLRRPLAHAVGLAERIVERFFHGIVVATPAIGQRFRSPVIVQNFPDLAELAAPKSGTPYRAREPLIAYVGTISEERGLNELVEALGLFPATHPARLVLAGKASPVDALDAVANLPGWSRVDFRGWCGRDEVAEVLASARVGSVVLRPLSNYLESYPVKLFEYMAAGLPVVASNFPLWRRFVEEPDCGLLVDPLDPKASAEAYQWVLDHPAEAEAMGKRGQDAALERYNWEPEGRKLVDLYRRLGAR